MKSLLETLTNINESLEYNPKEYKRFERDYKKFLNGIEDENLNDDIKHALEQMAEWVKDLSKHKGLPMSYGRYEQFTYAFVTFDKSLRNGFGGLYSKDVTDDLIKRWEKATGYRIKNQYN